MPYDMHRVGYYCIRNTSTKRMQFFSNCFKKIYSQREEWLKLNNECTLKMAKQMGINHLKMTKMGRMSNLFINGCVLVV